MPYFKIVWMKFTCILQTNIVLDGRYWDFNISYMLFSAYVLE